MQQTVIVGCGDIGKRVAAIWYSRGVTVNVVVRNPEQANALVELDYKVQLRDLDLDDLSTLPLANNWIYYFAPPPESGIADTRMQRFLAAINQESRPKKIVYISTTGVYGDCQGEWVDEERPVNPMTDRGKRRLDAERQLQQWSRQMNVPVVILRVSGIYGPQRLPVEGLKRGQTVVQRDQAPYSNRIHQDDLAQVCMAAILRKEASGIFNVSDGEQSTMSDYFQQVATALDLPPPREVSWDEAQRVMSPGMLSYLAESRRISNKKMLEVLGIKLRYPTLADGLRDIGDN